MVCPAVVFAVVVAIFKVVVALEVTSERVTLVEDALVTVVEVVEGTPREIVVVRSSTVVLNIAPLSAVVCIGVCVLV